MPLYEYICEDTGDVIELIRPMAKADAPVEDPEHKGRVFKRKLSTFAAKSDSASKTSAMPPMPGGGCCCNPGGTCGLN